MSLFSLDTPPFEDLNEKKYNDIIKELEMLHNQNSSLQGYNEINDFLLEENESLRENIQTLKIQMDLNNMISTKFEEFSDFYMKSGKILKYPCYILLYCNPIIILLDIIFPGILILSFYNILIMSIACYFLYIEKRLFLDSGFYDLKKYD